ncbi:MAG: hypothetical protein ABI743_09530 [bacterium]
MTHQTSQRVLLLAVVLGLLTSCTGKGTATNQPASRKASTASPYFTITTTPASTLEDGHFVIEGQLIAEAGLDSENPIRFKVTDADTGLLTYVDLKDFLTHNAGDIPGSTALDSQTGEFVIDGEHDLVLEEGTKYLSLEGKDAQVQKCVWSMTVESGAWWNPTAVEIATARGPLLQGVLDALQTYNGALTGLSFESPIDWIDSDKALMTLFIGFWSGRVADPANAQVGWAGQTFEDDLADAVDNMPSTSDQSELNYRQGLKDTASWIRKYAEDDQLEAVNHQISLIPGDDPELAVRQQDLAYFQHTFIQSSYTPAAPPVGHNLPAIQAGLFDVRIYQDTGAPKGLWDVEGWTDANLESDTADPDNSGFVLQVKFIDQDRNGLVDSLETDGYNFDPTTDQHVAFEDTSSYGHAITPLQNFLVSLYLCTGGA